MGHSYDWFYRNYSDIEMSNFWSKAHKPESRCFKKSVLWHQERILQGVRMQRGTNLQFKVMVSGAWVLALPSPAICQLWNSSQKSHLSESGFPYLYKEGQQWHQAVLSEMMYMAYSALWLAYCRCCVCLLKVAQYFQILFQKLWGDALQSRFLLKGLHILCESRWTIAWHCNHAAQLILSANRLACFWLQWLIPKKSEWDQKWQLFQII
jgi:hypothetical protein